jgi:hypothetical protein
MPDILGGTWSWHTETCTGGSRRSLACVSSPHPTSVLLQYALRRGEGLQALLTPAGGLMTLW